MKILRTVGQITLNEGNLAGQGLFNISDESNNNLSLWFDAEVKNEYLAMTEQEFTSEATEAFRVANQYN